MKNTCISVINGRILVKFSAWVVHDNYIVTETNPTMISKTVDSTTLNFGRPLGLSMRGKKILVELMI